MSASFILAQVSDTHIMTEPRVSASGARSDHTAQLRQVFAAMREFKPDVILVTGDLVNDGRTDEYAVFVDALVEAPAPLYVLPGNHDDRALMREMLPAHRYLPRTGEHLSYTVENYPVRLICLDQIAPGETYGVFTPEMAAWLDDALAADPRKQALVALHHPPFATHDRLFDSIGLHEAERFAGVIERRPQVVRIVCGHHHRAILGQVGEVPAIVAPSSAWTYSLALQGDQPVARITDEKPGWALHAWSAETGFSSHFMGLP